MLNTLPGGFSKRFQEIEDAIDTNSNCALEILKTGLAWSGMGGILPSLDKPPILVNNLPCLVGLEEFPATYSDFSKASSTIRHLYREWSAEGAAERAICFTPVLNYMHQYYSDIPFHKRHTIKVLNPGCGLGRFVFELAAAGYSAHGTEISYHMLFGSMHMMNAIERAEQHRIYPFVLSGSNHVREADRLHHVMVPDICPKDVLSNPGLRSEVDVPDRLGISTGDFSTVFKEKEMANSYDVLATIFFLDTAKNPLSYIETAAHCLKPGGLWLNLGPLKWHFEFEPDQPDLMASKQNGNEQAKAAKDGLDQGIGEPGAVELAEEDVLLLLNHYGFEVIYHEPPIQRPTGYVHNPRSMETTMYYCSFWVARKRASTG